MFDVSWSELLILGIVTLIFVGPKELPRFLGQLGKYAGVVRRQANEFRAVFEQAMREAEMDQIQKEMRAMSDGVKSSLDDATRSIDTAKNATKVDLDAGAAPSPLASEPVAPEASAAETAPSILPPAANSSGNEVNAASGEPETPAKEPPSTSPGSV